MQRKENRNTIKITVREDSGRRYEYSMNAEGWQEVMRIYSVIWRWTSYPEEEKIVDAAEMASRKGKVERRCLE